MAIFSSEALFTAITRILLFAMSYSIGSKTRNQWHDAGVGEKLQSVVLIRVLAFIQACVSCIHVTEAVAWLTVRMFRQHELFLVSDARFTLQGAEFIERASFIAVVGWALAVFIPENAFQKISSHSIFGSLMERLNRLFWVLNCVIGLQLVLNTRSLFAFLAFCTSRVITFSMLNVESPLSHLGAFYLVAFLGSPLRPLPEVLQNLLSKIR